MEHDQSYKMLFIHKEMVRDLLTGFVKGDWLNDVEFDSLEQVSGTYITDDLRERRDDMVWRVRWGKEWIYIYLLLEFQSTIDPHMAARIMVYTGLLWLDLVKAGQISKEANLPPVLPIVLYNGSEPWQAATELSELLQSGPRFIDQFSPQTRYLLIDEGSYDDKTLSEYKNLVAALFRLEHAKDPYTILKVVESLIEWLNHDDQKTINRSFALWIARRFRGKVPTPVAEEISNLQEINAMMSENFAEWERKVQAEGKARGIAEGQAKGEARGITKALRSNLLTVLTHNFGPAPEWVLEKVNNADQQQLSAWFARALNVERLEELFQ